MTMNINERDELLNLLGIELFNKISVDSIKYSSFKFTCHMENMINEEEKFKPIEKRLMILLGKYYNYTNNY